MIPPSIILVVYAIVTEQNIAKLFQAALLPGLHTHEGALTIEPVAEAHGLPWTSPEQVLR